MSLLINTVTIPQRYGLLRVLGATVDKFIMESETVWSVSSYRAVYLSDGIFIVPEGVTTVVLCACAGGGGGSTVDTKGGSAGDIVSELGVAVSPGDSVIITIGVGGIEDAPGTDTTFGGLVLTGGAQGNYEGEGSPSTSCGGTFNDGAKVGVYFGGQAGLFGHGGTGEGGNSSGGGGGGSGVSGGTGGNGRIVLNWKL